VSYPEGVNWRVNRTSNQKDGPLLSARLPASFSRSFSKLQQDSVKDHSNYSTLPNQWKNNANGKLPIGP